MKALGYAWHPQTVSKIEKRVRGLKADEIPGLAFALETTVPNLMSPMSDEDSITFGDGAVSYISVARVAQGFRDGSVTWNGNTPVYGEGQAGRWIAED